MDQTKVFYTFPACAEQLRKFTEYYDLDAIAFVPNDFDKKSLKAKEERTCRYCGRSAPDVTFNKDAHTIPYLLGNVHRICDFECDSCNSTFGTYESSLAAYFGLMRSITKLSKGQSMPKHKVSNSSVKADKIKLHGSEQVAMAISFEDKDVQVVEDGTIIEYQKQPYVPFDIYKIFLKIAFAIMRAEDIKLYKSTLDFIVSGSQEEYFRQFAARMHVVKHSYAADPHCYVFKKKPGNDTRPTHIFQLYYESFVFQLLIPCNWHDLELYKDKVNIELTYCPPLFAFPPNNDEIPTGGFKDFSSSEKVRENGKIKLHGTLKDSFPEDQLNPFENTAIKEFMKNNSPSSKLLVMIKDSKEPNDKSS